MFLFIVNYIYDFLYNFLIPYPSRAYNNYTIENKTRARLGVYCFFLFFIFFIMYYFYSTTSKYATIDKIQVINYPRFRNL